MPGAYQHCESKHLHRYLAEFDFRYNNHLALEIDDTQGANNILRWRNRQASQLSNN